VITDWRTIAQRVALRLELPFEVVEQELLTYADNLKQAIWAAKNVEYEYFGLGKLVLKPKRIAKVKFQHLLEQYNLTKRGGRGKFRNSERKIRK
jgi:hypothetical protein